MRSRDAVDLMLLGDDPALGAQLHGHALRPRARLPAARVLDRPLRDRGARSSPPSRTARGTLRIGGATSCSSLVAAALGIWLNQLSYVYAIKFTNASTTALILGATPIFAALIAFAIGLERLSRALLARGGGLVRRGRAGRGRLGGEVRRDLEGDLLGVATAATWAAYSVAIAPLMRRYSPYRISAIVLVARLDRRCAPTAAPQLASQSSTSAGWSGLLLAFAVLGPLVLTNILWFKAVDRVGPSHATLFANTQPFVAAIFAVLLLGETLSWLQVVGGVGIGVGIWLARQKAGAPGSPAANDRPLRNASRASRQGYRFTIGRVLAIYSGLMIVLMLAALDQTIVATALPRIVSDLGGLTATPGSSPRTCSPRR